MTIEHEKCDSNFTIHGSVELESKETRPTSMTLKVYAFDAAGLLVGSSEVAHNGDFNISVKLTEPRNVEVVVGPPGDPEFVRKSRVYSQTFNAADWTRQENKYLLRANIWLPTSIWWPFRPVSIRVSGYVHKLVHQNGEDIERPVPYVKVEIFDVDRDSYLWTDLIRKKDVIAGQRVIRVPDLLVARPFPPKPEPGPLASGTLRQDRLTWLNPQPEPPIPLKVGQKIGLSPKPEPPIQFTEQIYTSLQASDVVSARVGEMKTLSGQTAAQLENLTITSKSAPWVTFPRYFYSKLLIGETYTKCDGYFQYSFSWGPWGIRHGRLHFDLRPDIIIKVTQVIDGVERVIYMDPYTSTRWDSTNVSIHLVLDDEEIVSGNGCGLKPADSSVFFTRIGSDNVWNIDQSTGTWAGAGYSPVTDKDNVAFSNVAYGYALNIHAAIGKGLSEAGEPYYYRLSVAKNKGGVPGTFTYLTSTLSDTRVERTSLNSESHTLGPNTIEGQPALYKIRDTKRYYWYWPDLVGSWFTPANEPDAGVYTVRLEVFDKLGKQLTSGDVDYRNGTDIPTIPLKPLSKMKDHCDLVLAIDNNAPEITLDVPKAGNECGVVKFSDLPFEINTSVNQKNGRLYSWSLKYVKGLSETEQPLNGNSSPAGLSPVPQTATPTPSSAPFTSGLGTTCAFALIVDAWSHIRNGYGFIYYSRKVKAVAVEKCPSTLEE